MHRALRFQKSPEEDEMLDNDDVETTGSPSNQVWFNIRRALSRSERREEDVAIKQAAERFFSKLTEEEIRQLGIKRSPGEALEEQNAGWTRWIFRMDCVIALICVIAFLLAFFL